MEFLRILSKDKQQILEIADLLLKERLAIDLNFKQHLSRLELQEGKLFEEQVFLLTSKTKSMLFPVIDKLIKQKYGAKMPEIYSIPIINMDWDQARDLSGSIKEG